MPRKTKEFVFPAAPPNICSAKTTMIPPTASGKPRLAIVIPVFNQLHYTKQCVETLNRAGVADGQIIIINNASTDGTAEFLAAHPQIHTVNNAGNVGCGPAWTQGAKLSAAEWTVVLNNDVLVPAGCFEGILNFAEENNYDIICPAMREGEADYDWQKHAAEFMQKMRDVRRDDTGHGVAFAVHRRVFAKIGWFNNYGGYEDDDFFRRVRAAGFRLATTGRGWLHHFGSITQKSTKFKVVMTREHRDCYRAVVGQNWFQRKIHQFNQSRRGRNWRRTELAQFGSTLRERRVGGVTEYN
jgi:GT2 family glycosyltransferase